MPIINPTLPNDGETIDASDVNNPFNAILAVLNGGIDANNLAPGAVTLAQLGAALTPFLVPTASLMPFAGASAPTGWLFCDGSSVLRASYSALFAALGTAYGSVDGTHFNIPDLRGRLPIGNDSMNGTPGNVTQRSTTITTTSGSPNATVGSINGISKGMFIKSTNVPAGTTVLSFNGTAIVMSANATATASTVAARISFFTDAQALGGVGGFDTSLLQYSQLPFLGTNLVVSEAGFTGNLAFPGAGAAMGYNSGERTGLAAATSASTGEPFSNIPPSVVTNYLIKT